MWPPELGSKHISATNWKFLMFLLLSYLYLIVKDFVLKPWIVHCDASFPISFYMESLLKIFLDAHILDSLEGQMPCRISPLHTLLFGQGYHRIQEIFFSLHIVDTVALSHYLLEMLTLTFSSFRSNLWLCILRTQECLPRTNYHNQCYRMVTFESPYLLCRYSSFLHILFIIFYPCELIEYYFIHLVGLCCCSMLMFKLSQILK